MNQSSISLRWLNQVPAVPSGVTWGIPWKEGQLSRNEPLLLAGAAGETLPLQSWPTAFWPDGSVKWTAHASVFDRQAPETPVIRKGAAGSRSKEHVIRVEETEQEIEVHSGNLIYRVGRQGGSLIREIVRGGRPVCTDGTLICIREEESGLSGGRVVREERFQSKVLRAEVEQCGPVRAVVRLEGVHRNTHEDRQWLPFRIRVYFYAGVDSFQLVHTFLYDGNPHKDFIKGLGMAFTIPMNGPLYNRHVRLAGDHGFFSESPKHLMTIRTAGRYQELYRRQFAGETIAFEPAEDERFLGLLDESPVWSDFKLVQDSADHYTIWKRTKKGCSWLKSGEGQRAGGLIPGRGYGHAISSAGLAAFAAARRDDAELAQIAWRLIFTSQGFGRTSLAEQLKTAPELEHFQPDDPQELPWMSTNMVSQWSLNVIMCLELIGDRLPATLEEAW